MKKAFMRTAFRLGVIYLGIVGVLALLESKLMYPAPDPSQGDWAPQWLAYEEVEFQSIHGNSVHGWFCEHTNPKGVVMLCHGNGEHVAFMADEMEFLRKELAVSVFAFDYRGYGKSEGSPSELGILADADAAIEWLSERTQRSKDSMVIWGRSLGGAVAVDLAARNGADLLVLDRTFSSMVDVAASHYPWLPVRLMLQNRYPSDQRICDYSGPILQFHGKPDAVVAFRFGRRLFDCAPSKDKQFFASETMEHNSMWPAEFYATVRDKIHQLSLE